MNQLSFDQVPDWLVRLGWTAAILAVSYVIGHVVNAYVASRVAKLATRTSSTWDDIVIGELRKRIPFWSLLIGAWLTLGHWPLTAESHALATRVISSLAVLSVTLACAAMATRLVVAYSAALTPSVQVSGLTLNLVRIVITTIGVLVIIKGLGRDITPMLATLGVGGLAVALALQDPLSNLFAGVVTTIAGQVRIGDYVRLDSGVEGHVVDFNWRATRLQALGGNIVIVPNAKLAQAVVNNFTVPRRDVPVSIDLAVDYASDLDRVERVVLEVAREVMATVDGAAAEFEASVRFHTFGDFGVRFTAGLRARDFPSQFVVKHEFVKRLHVRFLQEGIVIPFPITAVVSRDRLPVPPADGAQGS